MRNVRIFYKKLGSMKFVSHLDMNRFMSRLITRAKIPVWYTEGFHRHLYMNFALPLSLGFEGLYEIMDIRITDPEYTNEMCLCALKKASPADIEFTAVTDGENPMKNIGFAKFELEFEEFNQDLSQKLGEFLSRESILYTKIGKKGKAKEIDLIPKIKAAEITQKGVDLVLAAGSEDNLNPTLLISAFFEQTATAEVYYSVKRSMIYSKDLKEFK